MLHLIAACISLFPNVKSHAAEAERTAGLAEPAGSALTATAAESAAPASDAWHVYRVLQQRDALIELAACRCCTRCRGICPA